MKGISWATVISIGVHVTLVVALAYMPEDWMSDALDVDPIAFEIFASEESELETEPDSEDEPPEPETPPEDLLPEQPRLASAVLRPQIGPVQPSTLEPTGDPDPDVASSTIDVPDVTPGTQEQTADQRRRIQALIAPGNVARSGFNVTGPGPSQRGRPAGLQAARQGPLSEQEAEALHSGHLRRQAMAKAWITREVPEPQRQADGSYRYEGTRMTATIRPDGDVIFEHAGVQTNGFSASGSFDLTDAIMGSSGQNPHQAQEAWFMGHTRALRHRLEREHRGQVMTSRLRGLRGRLVGVWRRSRRSPSSRRRALFRIWDDMEEDESGEEARRIIIAFIRDTLPAGSEDEYPAVQLARLNASRESTDRFDPY